MIPALLAAAILGIVAALLWATRTRVRPGLTEDESRAYWAMVDERKR